MILADLLAKPQPCRGEAVSLNQTLALKGHCLGEVETAIACPEGIECGSPLFSFPYPSPAGLIRDGSGSALSR
jgi:hypothetical protein